MSTVQQEIQAYVDSVAPDRYRFFNDPVPVQRDELDRYMEDLQREALKLPGLSSVYHDSLKLGDSAARVRLILVYRPEDLDLSIRRFPHVIRVIGTRNVLDENYLSVDTRLLENVFKFDPLILPEYLFGENLSLVRPPDEDIRFFLISRLLDLFGGGYLEFLYRFEVQREVDTGAALYALRNVERVLHIAKSIMRKKKEEEWDRLSEEIDTLHREWFERGIERYAMLRDILRQLPGVLFTVVDSLNAYFERAMVVKYRLSPGTQPPQAMLVTANSVTAFIDPWDPLSAFKHTVDLSRRLEQFVSVLPISFGLQLLLYSTGSGRFSRYIKSCFRVGGVEGNMERPYIVWERSKLLERYLDLLAKVKEGGDGSGVLMGCEIPSDSALGRAGDMVTQQMGKLKLKKMQRFLQDEIQWETPAAPKKTSSF